MPIDTNILTETKLFSLDFSIGLGYSKVLPLIHLYKGEVEHLFLDLNLKSKTKLDFPIGHGRGSCIDEPTDEEVFGANYNIAERFLFYREKIRDESKLREKIGASKSELKTLERRFLDEKENLRFGMLNRDESNKYKLPENVGARYFGGC